MVEENTNSETLGKVAQPQPRDCETDPNQNNNLGLRLIQGSKPNHTETETYQPVIPDDSLDSIIRGSRLEDGTTSENNVSS